MSQLIRDDKNNVRFRSFKHGRSEARSLSHDYCFAVHEDQQGRFWIGTGGGLNRFDRATGAFQQYTERDGLPSSVICGILEDAHRALWLSTQKGLSRFDPGTETFANFDLSDGLQSNMFHAGAFGKRKNGAVLVGWGASNAGYEAARWVNGNVVAMGDLPGGNYSSAAALVSSDGATIVGRGNSAQGPEVFVWKESLGMPGLGDPAGGQYSSEPFGMMPDASVIVGEATSARGIEAFRWTRARGMEALGDLSGGTFHSIAFDVSSDGTIIVGFGNTTQGSEAFIWDAANGMRNSKSVLVAGGLQEVEQWRLTEATGISADGQILVGNGINPSGQNEGWIAKLR